jgi:hypothetical protein
MYLQGLIVGKNDILVEGFKWGGKMKKMEEYFLYSEFFMKKIKEE